MASSRPIAGPLLIAALLVLSWWLPLSTCAVTLFGVASTVVFVWVCWPHRAQGRRIWAKPGVLAAGVMWVLALFTIAYAIAAGAHSGALLTNDNRPAGKLGVAALLATAMGIAGGEVGVHVQYGARVIAHIQLLLVVGGVAGVGGLLLQRLTGGAPEPTPPPGPRPAPGPPQGSILELYARVHARLTARNGDAVLEERGITGRPDLKELLRQLPDPRYATDGEALAVFRRIVAGDLEIFYPLGFEPGTLGQTLRPWVFG